MRILIAGCGYVGMRLAEKLLRDRHTVFGLRRNPPPETAGIPWVRGDLTDSATIDFPEVDTVVLAAGLRRDTEENYRRLFVDGYQRLLVALVKGKSAQFRVVMVSTTGVFAEENGGWVDEQSPVQADRSPGRFYLDAENMVQSLPCTRCVVRLSGIYGPDRSRLIREVREKRAMLFPPPPHYLNHLHADDAAGALAHVVTMENPAPMYIASDREPSDLNVVLQWISSRLGGGDIPLADEHTERPSRRSGNKRCRSDLLIASGYHFKYPTFREGYRSLLTD